MASGGARLGAGRKVKLENVTKQTILRLSASTILKALRDSSLDLQFRAALAKDFVLRQIPNKVEVDGELKQAVIFIADERAIREIRESGKETPLLSDKVSLLPE